MRSDAFFVALKVSSIRSSIPPTLSSPPPAYTPNPTGAPPTGDPRRQRVERTRRLSPPPPPFFSPRPDRAGQSRTPCAFVSPRCSNCRACATRSYLFACARFSPQPTDSCSLSSSLNLPFTSPRAAHAPLGSVASHTPRFPRPFRRSRFSPQPYSSLASCPPPLLSTSLRSLPSSGHTLIVSSTGLPQPRRWRSEHSLPHHPRHPFLPHASSTPRRATLPLAHPPPHVARPFPSPSSPFPRSCTSRPTTRPFLLSLPAAGSSAVGGCLFSLALARGDASTTPRHPLTPLPPRSVGPQRQVPLRAEQKREIGGRAAAVGQSSARP